MPDPEEGELLARGSKAAISDVDEVSGGWQEKWPGAAQKMLLEVAGPINRPSAWEPPVYLAMKFPEWDDWWAWGYVKTLSIIAGLPRPTWPKHSWEMSGMEKPSENANQMEFWQ